MLGLDSLVAPVAILRGSVDPLLHRGLLRCSREKQQVPQKM